jgi:hypothetical protein
VQCIKCNIEMSGEFVADTCTRTATHGGSYAFNVYCCHDCMIIARENVWDHKGVLWVFPDNKTQFTQSKE